MRFIFLLYGLALAGCGHIRPVGKDSIRGPSSTTLPMYRNPVSKDKIFVEVRLHDGPPRIFLVDTGSSLSVVSRDLALELGLKLQPRTSTLVGVAGHTNWVGATLPEIRLGRFRLANQDVAVGVKGIPTHVGLVPLDGILGNDVLGNFQVEVDYPAQRLRLSRPGEQAHPDHAVPLYFDGQHPKAEVRITARNSEGRTVEQTALLDVDTGATGLLLMGPSTRGLESVAVKATTQLQGVGSAQPVTIDAREVSIVAAQLGGTSIDGAFRAQWVGADRSPHRAPEKMPGLLGHQILKRHRVFIDYPAKRFALTESNVSAPDLDLHRWYISRGAARKDGLERVRSLFILGERDEARTRLERLASKRNPQPTAVALLARIERREGRPQEAAARLARLSVRDLIETGEIVSSVNALWLNGQTAEAIEQARMATVLEPEASTAWLALADARLANREPALARRAMNTVVELEADPSAHLIRRGIIALIDGDHDGALAYLRRQIQRTPRDGYPQWLYAMTAQGEPRKAMVASHLMALDAGMSPAEIPLDFRAGAWHILEQVERVEPSYIAGLSRDCGQARSEASRQNCEAWYQALTGRDIDGAEAKISSALKAFPDRAEFLDTLAVVLSAKGDTKGARNASWAAARYSPDDVYLFTQALRYEAALTLD